MWPAQNRPVPSLFLEPALLLRQPACLASYSCRDTPERAPVVPDAAQVLPSSRGGRDGGRGKSRACPRSRGWDLRAGGLAPNWTLACLSLKVKVGLRTGLGPPASCPLSSVVAADAASLCSPPVPQTPEQGRGSPSVSATWSRSACGPPVRGQEAGGYTTPGLPGGGCPGAVVSTPLLLGASTRDPTHDKVMRRRSDKQSRSGLQEFRKAALALTLKMVSVFLMLAILDYSLISVTQVEGLLRLLSKQNQLRTLINMSPGRRYPIRLSRMKGVFQFRPLCWHSSLLSKCVLM